MKSLHRLPLLAGIAIAVLPIAAEANIEHICTLGETLRRIEVNFSDARRATPCEVVYVKETERAGERSVLWTADKDGAFCVGKASDLANRLQQHGWRCRAETSGTTAVLVPAEPASVPPPPPRPKRAEPAGDDASGTAVKDALPEEVSPDETVAALPRAATVPGAAGRVPEPGPELDEPISNGATEAALVTRGGELAGALEEAVARDLARLKTSADDRVEASIEGFGDLNGDDLDDAAVLITFDADGADHAQYLVAYVAEQDTFRPAASRFIGGRYRKVFGADVEAIENGRILLELQVLEPEDPYCCPSGTEAALFALQNGELVNLP
jgi:hypothetical protein